MEVYLGQLCGTKRSFASQCVKGSVRLEDRFVVHFTSISFNSIWTIAYMQAESRKFPSLVIGIKFLHITEQFPVSKFESALVPLLEFLLRIAQLTHI